MVGKRTLVHPREPKRNEEHDDVESGFGKKRFPRFKDAVDLVISERTTTLLKKQIRDGIEADDFEQYRTSESLVSRPMHSQVFMEYILVLIFFYFRLSRLKTRKSDNTMRLRTRS